MPFVRLIDSNPTSSEHLLLDETIRKQKQHQIANYLKQWLKETMDKGPESLLVTIADDMIIVRTEGYLTKIEKYIIKNKPTQFTKSLRKVRLEVVNSAFREGIIMNYLENAVDAKVVCTLFESYPEEEFSVWLVMFDRKLV